MRKGEVAREMNTKKSRPWLKTTHSLPPSLPPVLPECYPPPHRNETASLPPPLLLLLHFPPFLPLPLLTPTLLHQETAPSVTARPHCHPDPFLPPFLLLLLLREEGSFVLSAE